MKKFITIALVVVMALALSVAAFATDVEIKDNAVAIDTSDLTGWVEIWKNGEMFAFESGSFAAVKGDVFDVFEDGNIVASYTAVEPQAEPQESTQPADPQESTQPADPQESTQPADPQESTQPVPEQPADNAPKTDSKGASVPKTGEADYTVALVVLVLAGAAGMIVTGKKYGEN